MNGELPDVQAGFRNAEEPDIKLPTSVGSSKKQGCSRKTFTSVLLTRPNSLTVWITANCGKFLKRWEYQTTWPASWEISMQVRKKQLELYMEQLTGCKSGKEYIKAVCILSPCLFNLHAEYLMWNAGLDEVQPGIKIDGRNISKLRHADYTTLIAESEEELKSPLMKVKEKSEEVGLKLSIQKTKIMEYGPITSWQIDGETMEMVTDFISGGSSITEDGGCSHRIKRRLLLGRKAMTKLVSLLESRDITLPTKVHLVKAVFSSSHVWMWELDYKASWAPKNWCFWTVLLEKTFKSPLHCKEIKHVNPQEISLGYSFEGLMLKLKLQYFTSSMWCEELTHLKRPWC